VKFPRPGRRTAALALAALATLPAGCLLPGTYPRGRLQERCEELVSGFDGVVGFHVRNLRTGESASLRADELFPTASLVKVPILCATFAALESGALGYHRELVYTADRLYPGEDLLGSFADGEEIDVAKLCLLMITTSDNTASLWLQEACGTGTAVNDWLDRAGFGRTRVNSRTPGREANRERFGWGETTPREMAELLVRIREGRAVSPAADEEMRRILTRTYWDGEALASIPPEVQVMSKQGAVSRSRSEVCLVHAPSGDYVFCLITKDQDDTSFGRGNAGYRLLREFSAALWEHFEPDRPWRSADPEGKYW
jgi:beta-lactamase class A